MNSYVRDLYHVTRNSNQHVPTDRSPRPIHVTRATRADTPGSEETPLLREADYVHTLSLESLCSVRTLRILLVSLVSLLFIFMLLLVIPATRAKILHDGTAAELGLADAVSGEEEATKRFSLVRFVTLASVFMLLALYIIGVSIFRFTTCQPESRWYGRSIACLLCNIFIFYGWTIAPFLEARIVERPDGMLFAEVPQWAMMRLFVSLGLFAVVETLFQCLGNQPSRKYTPDVESA